MYVAWDTETDLFGPGRRAPPLACVSVKYVRGEHLFHWTEAEAFFDEVLSNDNYVHIGHNIAYDFAVIAANFPRYIPAIFRAYDEGRVRDTLIRQKLLDIAVGCYRGYLEEQREKGEKPYWVKYNYDLDSVYCRHTGKRLDKDTWRKKYGQLRKLPLHDWPAGARRYPLDDARATWDVFFAQDEYNQRAVQELREHIPRIVDPDLLGDEASQCRHAFWIQLMHVWGIRTRPDKVRKLKKEAEAVYAEVLKSLQQVALCPVCSSMLSNEYCDAHGGAPWFVKEVKKGKKKKKGKKEKKEKEVQIQARYDEPLTLVRKNGVRDTKAAKRRMIWAMGSPDKCRRTKKGGIQLDKDACAASQDPLLSEYSEISQLQTVINKDLKFLMKGRYLPIHSSFNTLLATGRTSSSKPNIQNIRTLPGIRECFVPRKGKVFLDADYDGLELRTLAQVCLKVVGFSKLVEVLLHPTKNDPHLMFAMQVLGISYEEALRRYEAGDNVVYKARQTGKVVNFGFPGGLGYEALVIFAWKLYGVKITVEDAKRLKRQWMRLYPEMEKYFAYINRLCSEDPISNTAVVQQLFVKRIRGGIRYTVACNGFFQGLGSDATKDAGWLITKACYLDTKSPLYGCRIVNYIHDQFLVEADEEIAHEACMELKRLMILGASPYLPDVPPTVKKPVVARCWSKKASQVWENDRLVPWEEEKEAA